jgi:predicted nucleotidyltransferase
MTVAETKPFWETNLIYRVVIGSQAYGLSIDDSDLDMCGVCIPPRRHLLGMASFEQYVEHTPEQDTVIYALVKFVRLALKCNPNIIEALYTAPEYVVFVNDYGQQLREHRHLFLTRKAGQTFSGYAISQLRRMERHHRCVVDPPDHRPAQGEFGGRATEGRFKFPDHDAERAYRSALKHWNHYQNWRRNRNPERAELERRYGYDTKHAMHLLRLLRMGMEILESGEVHVYRPDREWLRAVREGALAYQEVLALASEYEARLAALEKMSSLPEEPDREQAEELVMALQERFLWEIRGSDVVRRARR